MPISITVSNDNAELVLSDIKSLFPQLSGLPPMQEQPKENREPAPANDDKPKRTRTKKEAAEGETGESVSTTVTTSTTTKPETLSQSAPTAEIAGASEEIPDIEVVRAKLKQMGATDGLGHDKVFETLAHYKSKDDEKQPAKSASTLKPSDYNALIAEIDALLAGVK